MAKKTKPKAKKKPSKAGSFHTAITSCSGPFTSVSSPNWSNYPTLGQPGPFLLDVDSGKHLSNVETDKLLIMLGKAVAKILSDK